MRVVTYNVRGFRDGRERVAAVVRGLHPDVLLLQESGSRRDLRRFAQDVGMRAARDPWSPFRRRVKNAVLLADPWRFTSVELVRFHGAPRWYPRGALIARVSAGDDVVRAVSTHFGLGGAERASQADSLLALAAASEGGAVIVGGDLNATPDMPRGASDLGGAHRRVARRRPRSRADLPRGRARGAHRLRVRGRAAAGDACTGRDG